MLTVSTLSVSWYLFAHSYQFSISQVANRNHSFETSFASDEIVTISNRLAWLVCHFIKMDNSCESNALSTFPSCFSKLKQLCNVCGQYVPLGKQKQVHEQLRIAYFSCFGIRILENEDLKQHEENFKYKSKISLLARWCFDCIGTNMWIFYIHHHHHSFNTL